MARGRPKKKEIVEETTNGEISVDSTEKIPDGGVIENVDTTVIIGDTSDTETIIPLDEQKIINEGIVADAVMYSINRESDMRETLDREITYVNSEINYCNAMIWSDLDNGQGRIFSMYRKELAECLVKQLDLKEHFDVNAVLPSIPAKIRGY